MHATLALLRSSDFPQVARRTLETLQVNLGYRCNQACLHCHVNASPDRKEMMDRTTVDQVLDVLSACRIANVDVTGGAPELNPHFRHLVRAARAANVHVIDRCNLTVLNEPGLEDLAEFLARHGVEITASLPCYLQENVDRQRGERVFESSLLALRKLNALGYGAPGGNLLLNLVYNPLGPSLPPAQEGLEATYKRELANRYGVVFNRLFTLANMPIARFGSTLVSQGKFASYMALLKSAHNGANLDGLMCRSLVSVDYRGFLYDCDFNQMLGIPIVTADRPRLHVTDLLSMKLEGTSVAVADHCYGCTAGQGSSCGGALAA
jgi:radical SAM/Cys-rich protein